MLLYLIRYVGFHSTQLILNLLQKTAEELPNLMDNTHFISHREWQNKSYTIYGHVKLNSIPSAAPYMNPKIKKKTDQISPSAIFFLVSGFSVSNVRSKAAYTK